MATFKDVVPLIVRQTEPAREVLTRLHGYFYSASLNGTRLQNGVPADPEEVRHHMHERADFLDEPTGRAIFPAYDSLRSSFQLTHWTREQQAGAINAARGAMSAVIDRKIHNGHSWTDEQTFREEASAEATLAAAHHLGMN